MKSASTKWDAYQLIQLSAPMINSMPGTVNLPSGIPWYDIELDKITNLHADL